MSSNTRQRFYQTQKVKNFACKVLDNVYVRAGKSRVACVTFSTQPDLTFSFDRYHTLDGVKGSYCLVDNKRLSLSLVGAIQRISYNGGSTFVGRALQFAAGILAQVNERFRCREYTKHENNAM